MKKEVREGYKMTELGEIPNEWEVCRIDDLCKVNSKSLNSKTEPNLVVNYIDIESVSTGKINNIKQMIFSQAPSRARRVVKKNDVIMSTVRPYLKAFVKVKSSLNNLVCSTGFAVLEVNEGVNSEFVYQSILSNYFIEQIKNKMVGSNYPAVNSDDVKESKLILPSIQEQEKIAEILSTVDEQIENTEKLIQKNQELKKGLMQQLLTKGIGHKEFKETELGEIPKEWEVKKIGEISDFCSNGFVGTATPYYSEKGTFYLMSNNVRENKIDTRNMIKVNDKFVSLYPRSKIYKDDMLTVQSGHIGTSCVVTQEYDNCNCHALIITRFKKRFVDSNFISYYLNSDKGKDRLSSIFVGSTIKHINVKDLVKFFVPVPEIYEQRKIVSILSSLDGKIEQYRNKKEKLEEMKKGLMQQLLKGKIRVV